jgi:glycosyltransferase involved in cell wall biosynthesis
MSKEIAFISVVVPVMNRSQLLMRALVSIQNQTFRDYEVLIVDDGSTENILSISEKYKAGYLKSNGKGVSAARNTGVHAAQSDWIAFLDSDDEWLPEKLEKQRSFLIQNPQCSFVHTNEIWIRDQKTVQQTAKQKKYGGKIFKQCTERCLIAPSSVLMHKKIFSSVGLFDETFPVCEDFDLWLRITSQEDVGFLEEALTIKHAGHGDQLSEKHHSMDLWRLRALVKHLDSKHLTDEEKRALQKSLFQKIQILLKGFKKYPNPALEAEVSGYLQAP